MFYICITDVYVHPIGNWEQQAEFHFSAYLKYVCKDYLKSTRYVSLVLELCFVEAERKGEWLQEQSWTEEDFCFIVSLFKDKL